MLSHSSAKRFTGLPTHDPVLVEKWDESMQDPARRREFSKLLSKVPLFAAASADFRYDLCEVMVPADYGRGQKVYSSGQTGDWMALVISGRLHSQSERDHHVTKVADVAPGGIVGDMGLLGIINHRTMTVLTAEPTTLVLLTKAAFEEIVQRTGGHEDYSLLRDAAKMQNLSDDKESFCDLACFSRLEREFVSALCEQLETRLLYPGNVLMKENENGNEMFILYAGMCKVAKGGIHLADLGNGVVIGELAVLGSDKRRTATVTITSLTLVYVLNGDVVHDILERFPNAKKIYDHEYVARLLHFELHKVKDEIEHLNNFYGKAHPMKTADVRKHIMGIDDDPTTLNSGGKSKKFAIEPPKEEGLSEFQKRMTQVQT